MNIVQAPDNLHDHWDDFAKAHAADGGLLQSWAWGDFKKSLGHKIFRLAVLDGSGELKGVALLIKHELPFEYNYLYCPRGPLISSITDIADLKRLFAEIKTIAREEKSFMVKVDPPWKLGSESKLEAVGFRRSEYELQPKCNFILNISKSEEELLNQMKQKTRYNIGLAQRREVKIRISKESTDIESFWQLMKQTAKRDDFKTHAKEYYKRLLDVFSPDQTVQLFLAEYDHKIVAANLVAFYGSFATYLHGASADLYREVMAPYLLQWEAILMAKTFRCHYYDFGGVNGETYQNPKWEGLTRFKTGFDPTAAIGQYIGGFELILSPAVFAGYKFVKQIRG